MKNFVSKHTSSIDQPVTRIAELIEQKERDYGKTINKKKITKQWIIMNTIRVFLQIDFELTYGAINRMNSDN